VADLLRIKRRPAGGAAGAPASLLSSEVAFNEVDRTLYYGLDNAGGVTTNIIPIAGSGAFLPLSGGRLSGGLSFGQATVTNPTDMSRHISLHDGWGGFSVTGGTLNLISGAMRTMSFQGATATMGTGVGLYLDHDPVNATEAVTLQYLQGQLGNYLPLSGGNLTGALGVGGNLTVVGASSFQNTAVFYPNNVAGAMAMIVYGQPATTPDTWAGAINFNQSGGDSELDFINLFSGAVSSFEWWQNNSANQLTRLATMKPNGDFYTLGQVVLGSVTPAQDASAASKWYVDHAAPLGGPYLPTAGGTMSGVLFTNSGINFNNGAVSDPRDTSRGIALWGTGSSSYGFAVTTNTLNYNVVGGGSKHDFYADTRLLFSIHDGSFVSSYIPFQAQRYIQINGDAGSDATLALNNGGGTNAIWGYNAGSARWLLRLGGSNDESGGPTGQDGSAFSLFSYRNDGAFLGQPFYIIRTPTGGDTTINGSGYVVNAPNGNLGIVNLGYLQANYPTNATLGNYLPLAGGTITGALNVNGQTTVNRFIFNEQNPGPMAGGGYGALTWNTDGGGDAAFVNGCNWASAGFSWYQVGASTWSRIMYLGNNGNLGLLGVGISYTLGGGGTNSMGFSWTGGKIHGWVDGNDQGALALESWVNTYFAPSSALGNYVAKAGDTMTGALQVNADITSSNTVSGYLINSATGRFQIASNASYYFERNSGNGIWNIVDGGVTVFKVDPADRGGTGTLGNLTVNGATSVKRFAFSENNNGVVPPEGGAGYLSWNATAGQGEVDFINAYSAYGGFNFLQVTGPGTWRSVFQIWPDGNAAVYGLGISYPGVSGGGNTMAFAWSGGWINAWVDGNFVGLLATSDFVSGNYVAKAGGAMSGGLSFGQATAPINAGDTSRHITLYDGFGGFSVTGGTINIVSNGNTDFVDKNGNRFVTISGSGLYMVGNTDINLVRDPSQPLHAATKQYVDGLWVINVKSYGATGNGSTDDTTPINNAVTAAGAGNLVFFPAGTYKITAPIVLPTLVSVSGTGASSIIAPATAGQVAFSMAPTAITETHNTIHDLQISPTANNCTGIKAVFCNHLKIFNVTFSGCVGRSIDLDRCRYYLIENCLIRSSMSFPGGTLLVQSSTWNSSTGGYLGGEGEISNIEFAPMTNSPFGQADPCIQLFSQPGTAVFNCTTSWGAYASGPTTHILIQNQCQGNTIRDNQGEGVFCGIIINDGGGPNSVMPNYIDLENNSYDNVGEIGIFVDGTAAKPADDIVIRGGALTNMHCSCIAATVASGGTGFVVGNIIQGPDVAAQQQGNPVMLQVTSIGAGGAITGVSIYNKGLVQTPPANPVPFHYGSGSGATFNLTYTGMGTGIWLRHVNNAQIDGVFMENYGGVRGGVGMMIESLYNARITGNQITQFDRVLYCQDTAVSNIVFAHNTCWNNNSNDFGGTIPAYSVVRDNIGEIGWIAGTPPVPASGVTVTNTAPYPMQIFIVSGSVSAITYMGNTLPVAATGNTIILTINRQHTIALTYTVAPGWLWVPME
jgi:hypothetical protein